MFHKVEAHMQGPCSLTLSGEDRNINQEKGKTSFREICLKVFWTYNTVVSLAAVIGGTGKMTP